MRHLRHTCLRSLQISDDERVGPLGGRLPLRQKQRGEKKTMSRQFDHSHIALSANAREGQFTVFQVVLKCRIETVVAKILCFDLCRTINLMCTAAGRQLNGLGLSNQRAGELTDKQARCDRCVFFMISIG